MILKNAVFCTKCKKEIESFYRHDFKQCPCGACMVDGGLDYLRRAETKHEEDRSLESDDFGVIKANLRWGTRGKDGDQPLKYVKLVDCTTEHLHAILDTQSQILPLVRSVIHAILEDRTKAS